MSSNDHISLTLSKLPNKPGVYQYFDTDGKILYVGKAKNLKKRVSSYFNKTLDSGKTRILVRKIKDIKFIIVETEVDALLLENNLIKKYQPRYNILLKDDKTYPWICIKKERFPRIFSTRKKTNDGSNYFGPYASVKTMNTILELVRSLYPLRNCNFNLSEENINAGKFKVCLEYHLGNCLGPCEGLQDEDSYNENIAHIKSILKGNINSVIIHLKKMMTEYADDLKFEKAEKAKQQLLILENYQSKSTVVSPTINNVDIVSIVGHENWYAINYMNVVNGAIVQAHTIELNKKLEESDEELLEFGLVELRNRFNSTNKEIIVPFKLNLQLPNTYYTIPSRGDKKKLLDLSFRNAKYFIQERRKQEINKNPHKHVERILETMQKDLRLKEKPVHIECFDNSNFQGTNPVAACVVFKNTKPSKRDYRHFNIKTVEGPDDFASMTEVVYRRYKRLLDEDLPLPQLIVIDGGKGQLSAALKALEQLQLRGKIAIIGIAKKLEELYFPGDSIPLYLDKKSETLKIIQQLRNEAHRFGITHHRGKRLKGSLKTELDEIKGIGSKTSEELLRHFKSIKRVKEATLEDLKKVVQESKAKLVFSYFKSH